MDTGFPRGYYCLGIMITTHVLLVKVKLNLELGHENLEGSGGIAIPFL
jgi:hypothetical protein